MMKSFTKKLRVPWLVKKTNGVQSQAQAGTSKAESDKPKPKAGTAGLMTNGFPQPPTTRFEDANPWEPEEHVLLYCMNGQDNVPARMKLDNDFVYYVSQSRSPGHKDQGQDCMANASHGNWEINLLCDGHDKAGHMVAMGVCQQLPKIILRRIHERNSDPANAANPNEPVSDKLVNEAFDEAARVVCWTSENITVGIWVKVFDGQWEDKPGYIKETNGQGKVRVAIIDENGYHLPSLEKTSLRRPRYTGGCTCLCMIRNKVTKECKVAVSGDSRMLVLPNMGINDAILLPQPGVEDKDRPSERATPQGLITPAHNVFNEEERERLEREFPGQYEFDGNFLVNPITKFAIQPTRGFGDFDMYGTGYTHRPEITKTFTLEPKAMVFSASDGVFDSHVWADEEIVSCLDKYIEDGLSSAQIVDNMYRETLQRSLEGGYVDDISIFCFQEPAVSSVEAATVTKQASEALPEEIQLPDKVKRNPKKADARKNRRTIGRGEDSLQDLNDQMEALRQARLKEAAAKKLAEEKAAAAEATDGDDVKNLDELVGENSKILQPVESVMRKLAESMKVGDKVDTRKLLGSHADLSDVVEKIEEAAPPPKAETKEAATEENNDAPKNTGEGEEDKDDDSEEDKEAENLI